MGSAIPFTNLCRPARSPTLHSFLQVRWIVENGGYLRKQRKVPASRRVHHAVPADFMKPLALYESASTAVCISGRYSTSQPPEIHREQGTLPGQYPTITGCQSCPNHFLYSA